MSQDSVAHTQTSLKKAFGELKPGQKRFRKLRDNLVHDPDKSAQVELKSTCFVVQTPNLVGFRHVNNTSFLSAALRLLFHVPASEKFIGRRQCSCEQNVCPSCLLLARTISTETASSSALGSWNGFLRLIEMLMGRQHDPCEFWVRLKEYWHRIPVSAHDGCRGRRLVLSKKRSALVSGADAQVRSLGHRQATFHTNSIGEPQCDGHSFYLDTFLSAATHKVEDACIRSEPVQLTRTLKLVSHNSLVLEINIKRVHAARSKSRASMNLSESCTIGDRTYELHAVVLHLGPRPNKGHCLCQIDWMVHLR